MSPTSIGHSSKTTRHTSIIIKECVKESLGVYMLIFIICYKSSVTYVTGTCNICTDMQKMRGIQ